MAVLIVITDTVILGTNDAQVLVLHATVHGCI